MVIAKGVVIKSAAALITVGGAVSTGVVLHKTGQFETARDVLIKGRIWGLNGEDKFGIPNECEKGECELSEEQLKKIKFKDLDGTVERTVTGLGDDKKIKFRMENTSDQQYPNKRKYIFDNLSNSSEITIKGKAGEEKQEEKELKIEKETEVYFKESGDKLERAGSKTKITIEREKKMKEVNEALVKTGLDKDKLKLTLDDFDDDKNPTKHKKKTFEFYEDQENDLKKVQFKELGGGAAEVIGLQNAGKPVKLFFDWTSDTTKFPNNMKFTFENANISPSVELKDKSGSQKIEFKKKSDKVPNLTFKLENYQLVKSS